MSPAAGRPRRTGRSVALAFLAVALLSAFLLFDTQPTGSWDGKLVLIPKGSPLPEVIGILREGGVLPHPLAFRALVLLTFSGRRLHYGESAEGYLFPESYIFVKPVTPEEILEFMVRQFRRNVLPDAEKRAKEAGLSLHQAVTIASIIEKETRLEEEKPIVSAVIRRRLDLGMPLQMDPTVIYGVKRFDGTVTRKDLRTAGPYNTYRNRGLPPGPIANPGLASLAAALNPSKSEYLYFVSKNDGSHTFSRTFPEHNRAVERFRRAAREDEE